MKEPLPGPPEKHTSDTAECGTLRKGKPGRKPPDSMKEVMGPRIQPRDILFPSTPRIMNAEGRRTCQCGLSCACKFSIKDCFSSQFIFFGRPSFQEEEDINPGVTQFGKIFLIFAKVYDTRIPGNERHKDTESNKQFRAGGDGREKNRRPDI